MKEGRSRSVWPRVTAALIGLPVLYVLSFTLAFWMFAYGWLNEDVLRVAAWPAAICFRHFPGEIQRAIFWLATLGPITDNEVFFVLQSWWF